MQAKQLVRESIVIFFLQSPLFCQPLCARLWHQRKEEFRHAKFVSVRISGTEVEVN